MGRIFLPPLPYLLRVGMLRLSGEGRQVSILFIYPLPLFLSTSFFTSSYLHLSPPLRNSQLPQHITSIITSRRRRLFSPFGVGRARSKNHILSW
ncbi:hypothetical protein LZ31DRAFT_121193 [Colletotrichum somersetense]|nr:hypothetical protein LZ31DRAFT_121193 [Colletotrichum somersetense]